MAIDYILTLLLVLALAVLGLVLAVSIIFSICQLLVKLIKPEFPESRAAAIWGLISWIGWPIGFTGIAAENGWLILLGIVVIVVGFINYASIHQPSKSSSGRNRSSYSKYHDNYAGEDEGNTHER